MSKNLLDITSDKYLKRLAKELRYRDSMYDCNGRIYSFEGPFRVENGALKQGNRAIDIGTLCNGNGESIVASRKA